MATSGLDLDAYFASKATAAAPDKLSALREASRSKVEELKAFKVGADQWNAQRAVEAEASKQSWVGKLDLEPGSFTANRVNDAASLVSGTGRLAGHIASLPINVAAMANTMGLSETEYAAYNRSITGTPEQGDDDILGRMPNNGLLSVKQKFDNAAALRTTARGINDTTDLTKIVEQTNRNSLNKDLGESFDANWGKLTSGNMGETASGLAGMLANTGAAILSNPSAVREYIVENAPQLFVGAAGKAGQVAMGASNIGYAADTYQKGIEAYAKKNSDQLPPEKVRLRMATQAASLAVLEHAGDKVALGLSGLVKKEAGDVARAGFKQSMKNVLGAGAMNFVTEGLTEGSQQYLEGEILGKPATAKEIYTAGVIGGASGAGLSGGGRAVVEMSGNTPEQAAAKAVEAAAQDKLATAANTGDVTSYADPASKDYHPGKAIEALYKNSAKEDSTPEQRQANTAKADEIIGGLETKRESVATNLALSTVAGTQKTIAQYETSIAAMEANDPGRAGMVAARDVYQENLVDLLNKKENPAVVKEVTAQLAALDLQLEQATKNRTALGVLEKGQNEVTDLVSIADTAIETGANTAQDALAVDSAPRAEATVSVDKVISLAMASPHKVSAEQAMQLVDNKNNSLTDAQRTYLRAFSEEKVAENTLKDTGKVGAEVFLGGGGNVGMAQHRTALRAALSANDQPAAAKVLQVLEKFAQSHTSKADLGESAAKGAQILRDKDGSWFVAAQDQRLKNDAAVRKNGGFTNNSPAMVERIGIEANALSKMVASAKAAYALKFAQTTPTTTGVENVPNVPQPLSTKNEQSQGEAAKTVKAVEPVGKQGTQTDGPGQSANVVSTGVVAVSKEAPASAVVAETAKDTMSVEKTPVTSSTEKTEVNSTSDEETDFQSEERIDKERADKAADLDRRIALLEAIKKCMGG